MFDTSNPAELITLLANDNDAFSEALAECCIAQTISNVANRTCGTKGSNFTLRMAVDEAAYRRYESSDSSKYTIKSGDTPIGELSLRFSREVEEEVEPCLKVTDDMEFINFVLADHETLVDLIEDNRERILSQYFNDGVMPKGCELSKKVVTEHAPSMLIGTTLKPKPNAERILTGDTVKSLMEVN